MSGLSGVVRIGVDPALSPALGTRGNLDPSARQAIALLSQGGHKINYHIAQLRRRYSASRKPLLGEKEPVESVFHVRPADANVPSMTVFRPNGIPAGPRLPAIVYLHGGGWTLGGLDTYEPLCRQLANTTGRVVIWVEYRLAPEHPYPAALEDSWKALEWIQQNADWIGVESRQIAIAGDSSGGNLAAVTALAARGRVIAFQPEFQLLIYPALDLTASQPSHRELADGYLLTRDLYAWYLDNYAGKDSERMDWRLSPLFAEDVRGLAPTILLTAGFDPLRDEAVVYAARLRDAGVRVESIHFPGMIHGFIAMGGVIPAANVAIARIAAAIDTLTLARVPNTSDTADTIGFDAGLAAAYRQTQGDI